MPGGECGVGTVLPLPSCVMGRSILGLKWSGDVSGCHTPRRGAEPAGLGADFPTRRGGRPRRDARFPFLPSPRHGAASSVASVESFRSPSWYFSTRRTPGGVRFLPLLALGQLVVRLPRALGAAPVSSSAPNGRGETPKAPQMSGLWRARPPAARGEVPPCQIYPHPLL